MSNLKRNTIIVVGPPRSGTSLITKLCISSGLKLNLLKDSKFFGSSKMNPTGYHEEVRLTLINDQLIRACYGNQFSFLFPPEISQCLGPICEKLKNFSYDIDEANLEIPKDFKNNLEYYTGNNYDYWGLSRMINPERWYKAYKKFDVNTGSKINKFLKIYKDKMDSKESFVVKDPRLSFTLPLFYLSGCKVIIVEREKDKIVRSMKRHYGPRIFSKKVFDNYNWVSNHFNLKIPPLSKSLFFKRYAKAFERIKGIYPNFLIINYEKIIKKEASEIKLLENFIKGKIDISFIKN